MPRLASIRLVGAVLLAVGLGSCSSVETTGTSSALAPAVAATPTPPPAPAASSPSDAVRTQAVVPGRPARVFILAAVGDACEPAIFKDISVSVPPAKGEVSFTPGQMTKIASSGTGSCLGTRAPGTGIYYTARAGMTGTDSFTVAAVLPTGETAQRSFTVQIAE